MTIIIPTLFKVPRLIQTLYELINNENVDEIILIDNTTNTNHITLPKVKHICETNNTFVNPAWNKGVSLSTSDKICILNDDIWFDWIYLKDISEFITENKGLIGMSSDNYYTPKESFGITPIQPNLRSNKGDRPFGYGCCFFLHKKNWIEIPNELKIFAGDDWLFYNNPNQNFIIEGLKCEGKFGGTCDDEHLKESFKSIQINDMMTMKRFVSEGLIQNYLQGTIWG